MAFIITRVIFIKSHSKNSRIMMRTISYHRTGKHCHGNNHTTTVAVQCRSLSRRQALQHHMTSSTSFIGLMLLVQQAQGVGEANALGFKKELKSKRKKVIDEEEYTEALTFGDGQVLKYYDSTKGNTSSGVAKDGDIVSVHFDCMYRNIDVVSTRSARLLGENRVIAEPLQFTVGSAPQSSAARNVDGGGGLFSGMSGPKAPPALQYAVQGMAVGGKRHVLVPADLGYGDRGEQEIPPGATFELVIELLQIQ